jgi:hypothetical protein
MEWRPNGIYGGGASRRDPAGRVLSGDLAHACETRQAQHAVEENASVREMRAFAPPDNGGEDHFLDIKKRAHKYRLSVC